MKKLFLLAALAGIVLAGCKKDDGNETIEQTHVYVAGYDGKVAKVWKDGVGLYDLTDGTKSAIAYAIFVEGENVYVAGRDSNNTTSIAKYWKNGQPTILGNGTLASSAICIYVSGSDIYVGGYENNASGKKVAKIWKNGTAMAALEETNGENSEVYGIFVSGNDVYATGYIAKNESGHILHRATYWKNGKATFLTDGAKWAYGRAITLSGDDIYIAGNEGPVAKYWKNGVGNELTNGATQGVLHSIDVDGSNIYIAGSEINNAGKEVAKYWKNNTAVAISDGLQASIARSICVVNSDIYVAGPEFNGSVYVAKVWKNGTASSISDGTKDAWLCGIFVTTGK